MKKNFLFASNWKMYKCKDEALEFVYCINNKIPSYKQVETIIFPQFTLLDSLIQNAGKNLKIGAQNMFYHVEGSFTGEISPSNLKNLGVEYVLLGHKDRRVLFHETDETVNLKILSALKEGLKIILCVGEHLKINNVQQIELFLKQQLQKVFKGVSVTNIHDIVIAYEPFWSVGSDCISENIDMISIFIRKQMIEMFSTNVVDFVRIIYGGSVNCSNIQKILSYAEIDGILVGRSSLNISDFLCLMTQVQKIISK